MKKNYLKLWNTIKKINLNIKDYKEYFQKYSSIEIEINLVDNIYGKFINILDEEIKYPKDSAEKRNLKAGKERIQIDIMTRRKLFSTNIGEFDT